MLCLRTSPRGDDSPREIAPWDDEILRLLALCCSSDLSLRDQVTLALSTVIGFSDLELATLFRIEAKAMEQRLVRAKRLLRESELPANPLVLHLDSLLLMVYLIFTEGHFSAHHRVPMREELQKLAESLAQSILRAFPNHPETMGLAALIGLHRARSASRKNSQGNMVKLSEQDRSQWDRAQISQSDALLMKAVKQQKPGPFQLEAAISSLHCRAPTIAEVDWAQITALYARLEEFRPSPSVRLNRSIAVFHSQGPKQALRLLKEVQSHPSAIRDPFFPMAFAEFHSALKEYDEALACLESAGALTRNPEEALEVEKRKSALRDARLRTNRTTLD